MNTELKELVDNGGFDIVLDELAVYAREIAKNTDPSASVVFNAVADELNKCEKVVRRLLLENFEFLERAQVIASMTDFSLNEVLESELEPGYEIPASMIAKIPDHPIVAPPYTYELIPDYEVYQVATKEELEKRGIDPYNENISQQTNKYWVLTIH